MRKLTIAAVTALTGVVLAACGATTPATSPTSGAGTSATAETASTPMVEPTMETMATTEATMETMATTEPTMATMATTEATSDAMMATAEPLMGTAEPMMGTAEPMMGTAEASGDVGTAVAVGGSIVDAATSNGNFTILLTALKATGLDQTLSEAGTYTVFAPTDEAFAALPQGTVESLLADPAKLTKILSYHVSQGNMKSTDVAKATSIPTLEGQAITVTVDGSTVTLNGTAKVTTADITTTNGTIHAIDHVLIPPDVQL